MLIRNVRLLVSCIVVSTLAAGPASAALVPVSQELTARASSGFSGGNDEHVNTFGAESGVHRADASFSYTIGTPPFGSYRSFDSTVTLFGPTIIRTQVTPGYEVIVPSPPATSDGVPAASGRAVVVFDLTEPGQLTVTGTPDGLSIPQFPPHWSLTGPDGFTFSAPFGTPVDAPAGRYTFTSAGSILRLTSVNVVSPSDLTVTLVPVVPEPATSFALALPAALLVMRRRRK
jgi:hypothetical protein